MKIKNFLVESAYFPGMLIALWFTVSSCASYAQVTSDSTFGALNSENILRDSSHATETIKVWDAAKWENVIVTPPPIRGDSLFIDGSTFVLLQRLNKSKFGWVTDSIKWVVMDTTFKGNLKCEHEWVYSEPKMQGNRFGAYVFDKHTINVVCARGAHYANGKWDESPFHSLDEHCQYEEREREKICRKCLRSEIEREQWYQRFVAPPKSEFELLKEKQNARHR